MLPTYANIIILRTLNYYIGQRNAFRSVLRTRELQPELDRPKVGLRWSRKDGLQSLQFWPKRWLDEGYSGTEGRLTECPILSLQVTVPVSYVVEVGEGRGGGRAGHRRNYTNIIAHQSLDPTSSASTKLYYISPTECHGGTASLLVFSIKA